jgi:hypothetical protein
MKKHIIVNKSKNSVSSFDSLLDAICYIEELKDRDLLLLIINECHIVPFIGGESYDEMKYHLKNALGIDLNLI